MMVLKDRIPASDSYLLAQSLPPYSVARISKHRVTETYHPKTIRHKIVPSRARLTHVGNENLGVYDNYC